MVDNKQARKMLENTTDCDIRIDNTVRYNESALHSTRRVDVQAVVELGHHIYGFCM